MEGVGGASGLLLPGKRRVKHLLAAFVTALADTNAANKSVILPLPEINCLTMNIGPDR